MVSKRHCRTGSYSGWLLKNVRFVRVGFGGQSDVVGSGNFAQIVVKLGPADNDTKLAI